jgi:cation transport protein ChaC
MSLTREQIKSGLFDRMRRDAGPQYWAERRTPEEFLATREDILRRRPPGADGVWVFGYGSLMWNPALNLADQRPARIRGYHRSYCLQSPFGRGTPENPGLMLALKPGGSVLGMSLRLHDDSLEEELEIVWKREMSSGAYNARWFLTETAAGPVWAISFVINPDHPRYVCNMPEDQMAERIASAAGRNGTCREYLENTVRHLNLIGQTDGPMHRLLRRVERIAATGQEGDRA